MSEICPFLSGVTKQPCIHEECKFWTHNECAVLDMTAIIQSVSNDVRGIKERVNLL